MSPAKKQLVTAEPASVFGEVPEEVITDPNLSTLYIKGYSDKRERFELARQRGEPAEPVSHRFHFVRHTGEAKRTAEFRKDGYRPVMWDDVMDENGDPKKNSYEIDLSETPALEKAPDGTCVAGDLQLMVVPAGVAAGLQKRHENLVKSQLDAGQGPEGRITVQEQAREVPLKR